MDKDKHVRRTGNDYAVAFMNLLPQGLAWPRFPTTGVLPTVVRGLSQVFGYVDDRAADLLEVETDPTKTTELLPEWERAWDLPDICIPIPPTDELTRRLNLVDKITLLGAQSRAFFIGRGVRFGETVTIREYAPYLCGVSAVGDTRSPTYTDDFIHFRWQLMAPEMRFYWTTKITALLPNFFGADLYCLMRKWKPAHTEVVFDYSVVGDDMLNFSEPIWDSSYISLF